MTVTKRRVLEAEIESGKCRSLVRACCKNAGCALISTTISGLCLARRRAQGCKV